MKKIISILLILLFTSQVCFAEENTDEDIEQYFHQDNETSQELEGRVEYSESTENSDEDYVYLDNDFSYKQVNISRPKKIDSDRLSINAKKATFEPFKDNIEKASKFSTQEYSINPVSSSISQKVGAFSFGTRYNSFIDSAQINYSTGFFTRYDTKHFALTTTYIKNTDSNYASYNNHVQVAPEWKINKRLSLLDVMQSDLDQIKKSNKLVLRYTPDFKKYADDVQFELGAGQSFYNDDYIKSSVSFSTNFKL